MSSSVERTGPDRPVQPVQPGTGRSTGPEIMQNRFAGQTGKNRSNPVDPVDPVNPVQPGLTGFSQFFFWARNLFFFWVQNSCCFFWLRTRLCGKLELLILNLHVYVIQLCCIERRSKVWKKKNITNIFRKIFWALRVVPV